MIAIPETSFMYRVDMEKRKEDKDAQLEELRLKESEDQERTEYERLKEKYQ